jgi:hypothetical protein
MGRLICLVVLVWFLYWVLVYDVARYIHLLGEFGHLCQMGRCGQLVLLAATVCRRCDAGGYSMGVALSVEVRKELMRDGGARFFCPNYID